MEVDMWAHNFALINFKLKLFIQNQFLPHSNSPWPQEGSLTAARGQQAHRDICSEVVDMCQVCVEL